MSGWEKCELGDVLTLQRGYDLPSQKRINGIIPIVSSNGISGYHNESKTEGPGVVTGRYGTIGEVFYIKSDFWPLNTALYIKDFKGNDKRFLSYLLKTLDIKGLNAAGAVPGVNRNHLHKIQIQIPPLPTQRRIASILSAYDDLIENNLKRIKLLEELAQRTYEEWFVKFTINGKKLEVNEETGLPEGWERKRADELFNIKIGKTPPRNESEWFTNSLSGVKWASIKDINNASVFISETSEGITKAGVKKFNMNVADKNTVILSFKLTVGKVTIVTEKMVTNEAIAHFNQLNGSKIKKSFTYCYLKGFNFNSLGSTSSIGTAINSKIVKALPFLLPDINILNSYQNFAEPIFDELQNLLNQNRLLKETRDILLPRLMSGAISVEEAEEEMSLAADPIEVYNKNN